jgi:hypothetical protein
MTITGARNPPPADNMISSIWREPTLTKEGWK